MRSEDVENGAERKEDVVPGITSERIFLILSKIVKSQRRQSRGNFRNESLRESSFQRLYTSAT